jgi:hypothetical protein
VQSFGTACHQKSEEWVALVSSGKVVCHICSVLRAVVVVIPLRQLNKDHIQAYKCYF